MAKALKLTAKEWQGHPQPAKGPYKKGVVNGPQPTTPRGIRRRKQRVSA